MISVLNDIIENFDEIFNSKVDKGEVKTMSIEYHKPHVHRIWFQHGEFRVFLHKIFPCNESSEALYHPHKWDSAMKILKGSYEMGVGHSKTIDVPPTDCKLILPSGTIYEMTDKDAWHYVNPICEPVFTIMVTGPSNGREMPIESPKEFRKLDLFEIWDILTHIPFLKMKIEDFEKLEGK